MTAPSLASDPPPFGLIVIGDEILSGKRADKHMPKVIELLAARGLALAWAEYLGDERERITAALRRAFDSGGVVFSCGGIGATPDDHTRQCAAAALGVPLALHPEAKNLIQERMRNLAAEQGQTYDPERPDNVQRLNMGVFPQGAQIIPNPYNRIPGFTCASPQGQGAVHFVPGFPVMAHPMIEALLDGPYRRWHRIGDYKERSFVIPGALEGALTPLMERIEREYPDVRVFSLPSVDHPIYGRHVELGVKGRPGDVDQAFTRLGQVLAEDGVSVGTELVRNM
ncbi:MAG TPA: molybdopterin-binding protein [Burkholderiaceae bacterium]|nr:molybdopterin-binding protein [Burkholderiaceae bacterium]